MTQTPKAATACNCTVCRRYGVLWAYGHEDDEIQTFGETAAYAHGEKTLDFHFCAACGCVAFWRARRLGEEGRRRMGVNLRLAEPSAVAAVPLDHLDGLESWALRPRETRRVGDIWY